MRTALGLAIAIMAAPAIAGSTPAVTPSASGDPDASKLICKSQKDTGTRFAKKKCMTKAQWDAVAEQHKRDAKEMIDKALINPPGD